MDQNELNWLTNFIWNIADDVLRDVYVRGKYRDVILPMTVLRRLDAVLEPTKQAVLDMKVALDREKVTNQDDALRAASNEAFYNTSPFLLRELKSRATQQKLRDDFEAYLDGFSPNVQDILQTSSFAIRYHASPNPTRSASSSRNSLIRTSISALTQSAPSPAWTITRWSRNSSFVSTRRTTKKLSSTGHRATQCGSWPISCSCR